MSKDSRITSPFLKRRGRRRERRVLASGVFAGTPLRPPTNDSVLLFWRNDKSSNRAAYKGDSFLAHPLAQFQTARPSRLRRNLSSDNLPGRRIGLGGGTSPRARYQSAFEFPRDGF